MVNRQVERVTGFALVAVGVLLFLLFGLLKGAATDVGVYAITIVPLVLGIGLVWRASGEPANE